jgi:Mg-chelatase subunit ChlD
MSKALVKGSLGAIAEQENKSLAESFLTCDTLLLADMSGSMGAKDAQGGLTRYEAAENDVIRLQNNHEGKIALISFSDDVLFCPNGKPYRFGGSTNLTRALKYIKPVDNIGVKIILISDGLPNQPEKALSVAKTFKSKIDVVYVGDERDLLGGRKFLEKLAKATGGSFSKSDSPGLLESQVETLMLSA